MSFFSSLKNKWVHWRVERILASKLPFSTVNTENLFTHLQATTPARDVSGYSYDAFSLWIRAVERSRDILKLPGLSVTGRKILELGAGDGVLASLLHHFGHELTISDETDWRDIRAKELPFIAGQIEDGLPLNEASFDLCVSYNSFEHFKDPKQALEEIIRLTKPGGLIYLHFGPLYNSPWGLHAYRSIAMPYAQFLFSDSFIKAKINELGVEDLGKKRNSLQHLNRWSFKNYKTLFAESGCEILFASNTTDRSSLNWILRYAECFRGRDLDLNEVIISGIKICLRKPIS